MPDFVFVAGLADDWRCRYWCVTYDLRGCHCEAFEKGRGNLVPSKGIDCFALLAMTSII